MFNQAELAGVFPDLLHMAAKNGFGKVNIHFDKEYSKLIVLTIDGHNENADFWLNGMSNTALKSSSWGTLSATQSSYTGSDHNTSSVATNDDRLGFQRMNNVGGTTSSVEVDTDNNTAFSDDDSEVAQITVSLASLVQLPTESPVDVELIECTLEDLVNGDTSETIQNVLRSLRGEHTQKSNVGSTTEDQKAESASISSRDRDDIKKRMIEKAKRINDAKLNAFAASFEPSSSQATSLVHDDISAAGTLESPGHLDVSPEKYDVDEAVSMSAIKLNPTAPSFIPLRTS